MPAVCLVLSPRAIAYAKRMVPTKHGVGAFISEVLLVHEAREEERELLRQEEAKRQQPEGKAHR